MIEYVIEHYNPDTKLTAYSFYRGESKAEVEHDFKKDFPKYTILSMHVFNGFTNNP